MKEVFIIHGWGGNSKSDWIPWLQSELEQRGFSVFVPDMPNTKAPTISEWVGYLGNLLKGKNLENVIFVAHSIGCQTVLRYIQQRQQLVAGAVFVAPWFNLDGLEEEGSEAVEIANPWIHSIIDFDIIKKCLPHLISFISSNEPYGYIAENTSVLESKLNSKVHILEKKGHFSQDDNCFEVSEVLDTLLDLLK